MKVKYADFQLMTRSRSCAAPIGSQMELEQIGLELLRPHFPPPFGVRLLGVTISNLETAEPRRRAQLALVLEPAILARASNAA